MPAIDLTKLTPAELMAQARAGNWARVDRELRRRGPDATREALDAVPLDLAALSPDAKCRCGHLLKQHGEKGAGRCWCGCQGFRRPT
ncbi:MULTISPECIES: hypothetical protein [unclassified Corallococcus]|uniref:hypothetical protein n=1 Tax=unclassified Corallococcus TaxID=2685029 RepID=UPI001A8EEAF5|nr:MULTISPECIES: hypothetical protein [unclassified Corallococcus]MBN9687097.1 hypothetical protein [Corallococcus sp. NCSPR001]WAS89075.1 hypothetical protein O0N60_19335 [Corallococcus sp. NCRR]